MPSVFGIIKIVNVGPSSIVNNGDSFILTATSSAKSFTGANSLITGDSFGPSFVNNAASSTNVLDPTVVDMPRVI